MKTMITLLALLATAGSMSAENKYGERFEGVWQQVQYTKPDAAPIRLPVWKVMQTDGSFCTFLIANQSGKSIITNEGTYKVTSDSMVVEHVTGSITDPTLVGKNNRITYQFKDKDEVNVTYRMPGASRDGHETWVRVKLEMPE